MCDGGVSAALLIGTIVSSAVAVGTAIYSARAAQKNTNKMAVMKQDEINAAASSSMEDRLRAARAARAEARVASAESGVSGISVDDMLQDIGFQSGRDVSKIEFNRQRGVAFNEAERSMMNSQSRTQAAMQIFNTAGNAFGTYQTARHDAAASKYTIPGGG